MNKCRIEMKQTVYSENDEKWNESVFCFYFVLKQREKIRRVNELAVNILIV